MHFKLHYWPLLVSGWLVLTVTSSYITAVLSKNVYPFWPHISELGVYRPASCVFSQMLNIGALLTLIMLYIRYEQIDIIVKSKVTSLSNVWNQVAFYLGLVVPLGLSLVANFQDDANGNGVIFMIHGIGTFCSLGIGIPYILVQTRITIALQPYYDRYPSTAVSKATQYFRLFLTVFYITCFIIIGAVSNIWASMQNGVFPILKTPDTPGYIYHLISAISEWCLAISFFSYTLTLTNEFKAISFKKQFVHLSTGDEIELKS